MTTNSPNPVDGDVQALIADCEAEIAELEKVLAIDEYAAISHLQSKLKRQQIALAALTAEAETPASFVTYWPDTEDESDKPHSESNEACARRIAGEIGGYVRPCFIVDDGLKVYTTPPAQLLRPVELPEAKDKSQGWKIDPDYLCRIAEHIGESEEHGAAPCLEHIEAVLLAVNEVKEQ